MNDTLLASSVPTDQTETDIEANAFPVPEKFKNPETGEVEVEKLLKSYLALEKKLSDKSALPPALAEEYCIDCSHGLFEPDLEINQRLQQKGFNQEQAQEVYNLAAEKMVPLILDLAAEFEAEREIERLKEHFGGEEKWREVSGQLLNFGQKNLSPEVLKGLSSSYEGVLALYKMMAGETKEKVPSPRAEAKPGVSENELYSMMREPKYWRDKDPSMIEKVTKGFQNLYGK